MEGRKKEDLFIVYRVFNDAVSSSDYIAGVANYTAFWSLTLGGQQLARAMYATLTKELYVVGLGFDRRNILLNFY
jgi:hypothetical protein